MLARAAAAMAGEALRGPGRCQQVWCPVCALAALISGEQHPMLTAIAEHSVALMSVIQAMVAATPAGTDTAPAAGDTVPSGDSVDQAAGEGPPPASSVRFHHIPIVLEDDGDSDLERPSARDADV